MSSLVLDKVSVQLLSDPQKDGWLTKLGGKGLAANWKKRWFVMKDDVLYYFKAKKASGHMSLSSAGVSEGGKSKKYCFKIESDDPKHKVFYMAADSEEEMRAWMDDLSAAVAKAKNPSAHQTNVPRASIKAWTPKRISSLYINVPEARKLKASDYITGKCDPYVIVDVLNCQVRTRTIYKSLSPFWGEDFHIDMVEFSMKESQAKIKVTVWDEDKFTKDTLIGEVMFPVTSLSDAKLHEQWYPLFPADAHDYVSGDIHLRIDHNSTAKTLSVRVIEGRNLASKDANGLSDPYVKVSFSKQKKKTKVIKKTLNPFFNEDFVFDVPEAYYKANTLEDLQDMICTLQVECWDWDMVGANDYMGEYLQSPLGPAMALLLESVIGSSERAEFASVIVNVAENYSSALPLLTTVTNTEIKSNEQEETIFRGNSLATKGVDAYMKLTASQYLHHILGPVIKRIYHSKVSCELDPAREKEENFPKNKERLQALVTQTLESVFASVDNCPKNLKVLFYNMRQTAEAKYGHDSLTKYAVVSGFLFLRHICPAILNPKLFGLAVDHPDSQTARTLTLVSKVVQTLANLAEFGPKEGYLLKMNDLVTANMPAMKNFLEQVSAPPVEDVQPAHHSRLLTAEMSVTTLTASPLLPTEAEAEMDLLKSAAALRRFVMRAKPDLKSVNNDSNASQEKKEVAKFLLGLYS